MSHDMDNMLNKRQVSIYFYMLLYTFHRITTKYAVAVDPITITL